MASRARQLTYQDYLHLPADRRWEIVEGVPNVVPAPNKRHQEILLRLVLRIGNHLEQHGGGHVFVAPFDTVLTDIDVFQPDIVFVSDADAKVLTDLNVRGNPTWVIEILSNPYYERDKFKRYEAAGVPEHWLVNPYEDTFEISILEGASYRGTAVFVPPAIVRPRALPDLAIDLADILRR